MGRRAFILSVITVIASFGAWVGCGTSAAPTPGFGVPAVVTLAPTPTASINLGDTLLFSASALSGTRAPLTTTFSYRSTNPNIVSIADNGLACAGTWDSVATPVVCTPGGVGAAKITASSNGVVSTPTIVYVHQPIAQINVSAIPLQTPPFLNPSTNCYTMQAGSLITPQSQNYQAVALANDATGHPTLDITSSVGPFSWLTSQPTVASLTTLNAFGIPNGQVQVAARAPGMTQISASIADTTSGPVSFTTCPVQSIALAVNVTGGTTINAAKGTNSTVAGTIFDIAGNQILPTLSWNSSDTAVATVSSSGGITSPGAGGATIVASCIAPTCNINLSPPEAIYPATPISATYTSTTSAAFNVYTASTNTSCAANVGCTSFLVPITGTPPLPGNPIQLTNAPTSLRFAPGGATAYVGSEKGLMAVAASANPPTITASPTVTGKVLAVSPDGKKVIVSDTSAPVNQVFIFDTASSTSTNFLISGATAAAFSPDSLKAFIVAGTTLYVFSTQSAFQAATLPAAGTDVGFLANGMFGYVAEGSSGISYLATCDDPSQPLSAQVGSVAGAMSFLRPLPDGSGFIGLSPPNIAFIRATINGMPLPTAQSGCPAPLGGLSVSNVVSSFPGGGTVTPIAFLLSSDGQKAYIVAPDSGTITVFDLISGLFSSLALVGNPNPLAAALAPDAQTLYVSASDGKVHFVNTVSGGDLYQVDVPSSSLCTVSTGGIQPTCLPDLLVVRP